MRLFRVISIIVILLFVLGVSLSALSKEKVAIDFSTPQNTIITCFEYYEDKTILSKCFYPSGFINGMSDKYWISYKIINQKETNKIGEKTHRGILITKDAVEIIVEVKMLDSKKKNPKTKFWFLLQKVNDEWKIIEHSHIPDANYPAYD